MSVPHTRRVSREQHEILSPNPFGAHLSIAVAFSLRFLAITAAVAGALALPRAATSQDKDISGAVSVDAVGTRLAGHDALLVGGQVSLRVGSRVSIGGFGYGMPVSVRVLEGALPEDLRLGYGGLAFGLTLASRKAIDVQASLLVGAGNAQVHAQPIGNQLGSDNFLVMEPRLTIRAPQGNRLLGAASVGYRLVGGVEDLPRLAASDLRGWTVTLSVSIGGRDPSQDPSRAPE